jgi:hypothetical protein
MINKIRYKLITLINLLIVLAVFLFISNASLADTITQRYIRLSSACIGYGGHFYELACCEAKNGTVMEPTITEKWILLRNLSTTLPIPLPSCMTSKSSVADICTTNGWTASDKCSITAMAGITPNMPR